MIGIFALIFALLFWKSWYVGIVSAFAPRTNGMMRSILAVTPVAALAGFCGAFFAYADSNATGDVTYAAGCPAVCVLVLRGSIFFLGALGIRVPADVLERGNRAVLFPFIAAQLGVAALNVGANLGSGDEEYTTLYPLGIAVAIWGLFGTALAALTPMVESITVWRDRQAGLRFGLLWCAAAALLARASAGDWVSFDATNQDYVSEVPGLGALLFAGWAVEPRPGIGRTWSTILVAALAALVMASVVNHALGVGN